MTLEDDSLAYHGADPPGKIEIRTTKSTSTQRDLSLAYSPGVAGPCRAIAGDRSDSFRYTARGNLVAVVSDGSAVLGLGDIGPHASRSKTSSTWPRWRRLTHRTPGESNPAE